MNCPKRLLANSSLPKSSTLISGFTLVETLVALGILGIFFAAVAGILQQVLQEVGQSRVRTTALALAQEKMELVRNLPYANVGTIGGIPQGPLAQNETITINNQPFTITTSIEYVDDPFDGLAPSDLINTDYKRARVEITWEGAFPSRVPLTLVTNISPKGVETTAGGGTLFIQVFNANGQPVSNANIKLDNTAVSPEIHLQTLSNVNGLVVLPGSPACITCYQITVSKTGYSTDKTYSTSEVANPLQPYATVIEGDVTSISFAIDEVSSVIVNSLGSREAGFPPIAYVEFTLKGNKIIGYDVSDDPVYKYSFSTNTGGGTVTIPALEWDTYNLDFTNSSFNLAGSNPTSPFALPPKTSLAIGISAVAKTNNSLLVIMRNTADELLASASATLINAPAFISTKSAGLSGNPDFGQAFFNSLDPAAYQLIATSAGYREATASVNISGIKQETLKLIPTL